jgi:hypothetical protein
MNKKRTYHNFRCYSRIRLEELTKTTKSATDVTQSLVQYSIKEAPKCKTRVLHLHRKLPTNRLRVGLWHMYKLLGFTYPFPLASMLLGLCTFNNRSNFITLNGGAKSNCGTHSRRSCWESNPVVQSGATLMMNYSSAVVISAQSFYNLMYL